MNLYEILEVPTDADVAAIEKAFRKLSRIFHPDKANISTIPTGRAETKAEKEARERRNNENVRNMIASKEKIQGHQRQVQVKQKGTDHVAVDPELDRAELRTAELQTAELQTAELQTVDLRAAELRTEELRTVELRAADLRAADYPESSN
ncbi:hypothetical protein F5B22DRAFT_649927 [Xylaria bambusicola]|uniref:uncharacterized protein n=1 Tax=Xylaria bambusicola TaxID=326684 RepID=UPI00200849FB|nr:uncharacterized protein F5B22DRAFT_649927 [Xylaria bambusicola]KAI0508434.1 hypothetical protein F5B22DRAFT_649927 [Xylaria bambusicola]